MDIICGGVVRCVLLRVFFFFFLSFFGGRGLTRGVCANDLPLVWLLD